MVQIVPGGEDCSSVQTLGGVCTVLEAQKPAAFILENVDMESKGKKADDSQPLDSKGWLYIFSGIFWTYVGTSGNMGGWMDGWMNGWLGCTCPCCHTGWCSRPPDWLPFASSNELTNAWTDA